MNKRRALPRKGTLERVKLDAFCGGVCCCLSAALYDDTGTSTQYLEAASACDLPALLAFAKRENDPELPRLRQAAKAIRDRDRAWERMERRRAS